MAVDLFDELPDSLLVHILSFLNVKEAAITSVLSKRWEFLWTESPRLEFGADLLRENDNWSDAFILKLLKFVPWVNRTLAIRTTNYLEEFGASLLYFECFNSDIDAWVQYAVEHKVKKLKLQIDCCNSSLYKLPQLMYSCPSLTTLHLQGCFMHCETAIRWQSLTHLHLHDVGMDKLLVDEILSSCPLLYDMYLESCYGFDHLEINSPSVHSLSIVGIDCAYENSVLEISAPYIHSLYISPLLPGRRLLLENISSLVRADIDYTGVSWEADVIIDAYELLESLQHVKELYLGLEFIEVVSLMAVKDWPLPQSARELLVVVCASEHEHDIPSIISLLESSPNLETLILEGSATNGDDVISAPTANYDLVSDLLHLKTIKVGNFTDSKYKPILTLARILLKRATSLEEMVIMTDDSIDLTEMVQEMLTYPRSSTTAVVRLVN